MERVSNEPLAADTIAGIIGQTGDGRRPFFRLAMVVAALAVVALLVALLAPLIPRSLSFRANEIVQLPKDARVVDVSSDIRTFGDVYFTVPEPKGPGSRIAEIWDDARYPIGSAWSSGVGPRGTPAKPLHSSKWAPLPGAPGTGKVTAAMVPKPPGHRRPVTPPPLSPLPPVPHPYYFGTVVRGHIYTYSDGASLVTLSYSPTTHRYHFHRIPRPNTADPSE